VLLTTIPPASPTDVAQLQPALPQPLAPPQPSAKSFLSAQSGLGTEDQLQSLNDLVAVPGEPTALPNVSQDNPNQASDIPVMAQVLSQVRQRAWVDEVVGNINGKPVYASVFLIKGSSTVTALGPRLQRQADVLGRKEWIAFAAREISRAVNSFVEDELLRAEAIGSLKPEEKQGLFAFIDRAQRELERQSGGSRATAERRLMDEKGITMDEWRRQREDTELIRFELGNRIFQRINVSRRDIALRYQQLQAEYNKPPLATFRLIQVSKGSPQDITTITQLLAAQGFEAAAKNKANLNKPAEGGLELRELPQELQPLPPLAAKAQEEASKAREKQPVENKPAEKKPAEKKPAQLFNNIKLDEAAKALKVGETAGPLELTASVAWVRFESIDDRTTSLYDAQLSVEEIIRSQRVERERARFVAQLTSRTNDETVRDIVLRLLQIATDRYYPANKAEPKRR
jgi:hypothetical protein